MNMGQPGLHPQQARPAPTLKIKAEQTRKVGREAGHRYPEPHSKNTDGFIGQKRTLDVCYGYHSTSTRLELQVTSSEMLHSIVMPLFRGCSKSASDHSLSRALWQLWPSEQLLLSPWCRQDQAWSQTRNSIHRRSSLYGSPGLREFKLSEAQRKR